MHCHPGSLCRCPRDQPGSASGDAILKADFLSKALQIEAGKYDSLWIKKSFRDGIHPPIVKGSDAEVLPL